MRNPAKVPAGTYLTLAKYHLRFLEQGRHLLVEDLSDLHSEWVDPREMAVSMRFFDTPLSEPGLKKCPMLTHYMVTTQYLGKDKLLAQGTGTAICALLDVKEVISFVKKGDQLGLFETTLEDLRNKYLPILEEVVGQRVARLELSVYMGLVIRCLFTKPWPEDMVPPVTLAPGKYNSEKLKALGVHWAKGGGSQASRDFLRCSCWTGS